MTELLPRCISSVTKSLHGPWVGLSMCTQASVNHTRRFYPRKQKMLWGYVGDGWECQGGTNLKLPQVHRWDVSKGHLSEWVICSSGNIFPAAQTPNQLCQWRLCGGSFRRSRINHIYWPFMKRGQRKKENIYVCVWLDCILTPVTRYRCFLCGPTMEQLFLYVRLLPDLHIHQESWQYCNVLRCWQLALVWLWPYGWHRGAAVTQNFPGKIPITEHFSVMPMSM